jgi:hypothetical protein
MLNPANPSKPNQCGDSKDPSLDDVLSVFIKSLQEIANVPGLSKADIADVQEIILKVSEIKNRRADDAEGSTPFEMLSAADKVFRRLGLKPSLIRKHNS